MNRDIKEQNLVRTNFYLFIMFQTAHERQRSSHYTFRDHGGFNARRYL